jgi:hypothetical protein
LGKVTSSLVAQRCRGLRAPVRALSGGARARRQMEAADLLEIMAPRAAADELAAGPPADAPAPAALAGAAALESAHARERFGVAMARPAPPLEPLLPPAACSISTG